MAIGLIFVCNNYKEFKIDMIQYQIMKELKNDEIKINILQINLFSICRFSVFQTLSVQPALTSLALIGSASVQIENSKV